MEQLPEPSGSWLLSGWDQGLSVSQELGFQGIWVVRRYIKSYTDCVVVQAFQRISKKRR